MVIEKVGVVGCGLMGAGITQTAAQAGYKVVVAEANQEVLDKGLKNIRGLLERAVAKGRTSKEEMEGILSKIEGTTDLAQLKDCQLVIEAVVEDMAVKKKVFKTLDKSCPKETILATNTSSLTVAETAAITLRPDRVVGLHFFNPVPVMKLVEVVRTIATSDETFNAAYEFARSLGKEPIGVKDSCGFVVNLLLIPYLLSAIRALEQGVASIEGIDKGMKLGCGYPMGPFTLLDFVGLDTTYHIAGIMFEEFKERHYAPPPLLKRLYLMGHLGRKSGRGFYDYSTDPPKVVSFS
ncbi:MAG: 3-hydroxybutyryl-CoA dehydrogenase [Thermodesulfobacteriota bacterium]